MNKRMTTSSNTCYFRKLLLRKLYHQSLHHFHILHKILHGGKCTPRKQSRHISLQLKWMSNSMRQVSMDSSTGIHTYIYLCNTFLNTSHDCLILLLQKTACNLSAGQDYLHFGIKCIFSSTLTGICLHIAVIKKYYIFSVLFSSFHLCLYFWFWLYK